MNLPCLKVFGCTHMWSLGKPGPLDVIENMASARTQGKEREGQYLRRHTDTRETSRVTCNLAMSHLNSKFTYINSCVCVSVVIAFWFPFSLILCPSCMIPLTIWLEKVYLCVWVWPCDLLWEQSVDGSWLQHSDSALQEASMCALSALFSRILCWLKEKKINGA